MGFKFRKSIKIGAARINFSKSGVGASVGVKGFRLGRNAKGQNYVSASIPGTGVGYEARSKSAGRKPENMPMEVMAPKTEDSQTRNTKPRGVQWIDNNKAKLNRYLAFGFAGASLLAVLAYCKSQIPVQVQAPKIPAVVAVPKPFDDAEFVGKMRDNAINRDRPSREFINDIADQPRSHYQMFLNVCKLSDQGKNSTSAIYPIKELTQDAAHKNGFELDEQVAQDYASAINGAAISMGCDRTAPVEIDPN